MRFRDDNEKSDYFDGPDIPDRPVEPKKPTLKPDDPRYWEEDEDEFEHLRPSQKSWKLWIWVAVAGVAFGILYAGYRKLFTPKIEMATQYGYIESIEKHKNLFDTFEGVILPYKNLMDTTRVYDGDFRFSTRNDEVAAQLKRMQFAGRPVRVSYDVYRSVMPWRGETDIIITRVDSVNERDILPPDRLPATIQ